eukprot:1193055-Prorocentrum_minimum.AAC.3
MLVLAVHTTLLASFLYILVPIPVAGGTGYTALAGGTGWAADRDVTHHGGRLPRVLSHAAHYCRDAGHRTSRVGACIADRHSLTAGGVMAL